MTPREADVAYVLEGARGVIATYALSPRAGGHYDFAVHVDDARSHAEAIYALERVGLHHRDARVCFFHTSLVATIAARARRLDLTDAQRAASTARLPPPRFATPAELAALPNLAFLRLMHSPEPGAPFSVLLVDVDDDVQLAVRRIFRESSRHLVVAKAKDAAEVALTKPFHLVVCGHRAAAFQGFLDTIAAEDPCGAERVLVVSPARDVPWTRWHLDKKRRSNVVLPLPIDDALLQKEAFRDHPELLDRVAVRDLADTPSFAYVPRRFRRSQVLVVDDIVDSEIFFASDPAFDGAEVVYAKTPIEAFEIVVAREIDLLIVAGSMRGDGGEAFYRVLWRLAPKLKSRTVILAAADAMPSSLPPSTRPRLLERPLRVETIARVIDAFAVTCP